MTTAPSAVQNVDAEARVSAVELFIECANEDHAPETFDGTSGLPAAAEPFEHGDATFFLEICGLPLAAQDIEHGARDGEFVEERQRGKGGE